jgi:NADPH-dependent glutamate synthase beta subunit-like oxidoreductase
MKKFCEPSLNFAKKVYNVRSYSNFVGPQICIVGAGPAGFYVAQHLLKVFISSVFNTAFTVFM